MRQIAILPSGCQNENKGSVLYFKDDRIIYASSLAVYIMKASTFVIEKILSYNHKTITSISVSPHDDNLLVISGLDGLICLWNIDREEIVTRIQLNNTLTLLWDPYSPNHCAIITNEVAIKVYYW